MKHLLFAVFETNQYTRNVVNKLAENNINGTVLASTSLKHFMNELGDSDINFISLRHLSNLEKVNFEENTTFYALLEEEEIDSATAIIREETERFSKVRGGMFVLPVERYEGSF